MFGIAGTAELSTFCPGTGTWNRLQDGTLGISSLSTCAPAAIMHIPHVSYTHLSVATCHSGALPCLLAVRWQNGHEAEEVTRRVIN